MTTPNTVPCGHTEANPKVAYFARATWKNGVTDIQVRQTTKGYRVIDHCCEHITRDGTGVSFLYKSLDAAKRFADFFAKNLEGRA